MSSESLHLQNTSPTVDRTTTIDDRVIEPDDFIADTEAFVDVRIPHSKGKASYSFIGPGVSQNADQKINLTIPHGFNVGAATLPHGAINNPHLHFTAEVFVCTRGSFRITIGEHAEQHVDLHAGMIFSAPTWVFRGFENIGDDDGWMFAVLGGDNTGGILWAPGVLREAAETGLYLAPDYSVLDETAGDDISDTVQPLCAADLANIEQYSDAELRTRLVTQDDLDWNDRSLLSSTATDFDIGPRVELAPVLGNGMTEHRRHVSPITNPHGFSIEWLRLSPGASTDEHRLDDTQVLLVAEGHIEVAFGAGDLADRRRPAEGSVISVPEGMWRTVSNIGDRPALVAVVCNGDGPSRVDWSAAVADSARTAGWARDQSGFIAPANLVGEGT